MFIGFCLIWGIFIYFLDIKFWMFILGIELFIGVNVFELILNILLLWFELNKLLCIIFFMFILIFLYRILCFFNYFRVWNIFKGDVKYLILLLGICLLLMNLMFIIFECVNLIGNWLVMFCIFDGKFKIKFFFVN